MGRVAAKEKFQRGMLEFCQQTPDKPNTRRIEQNFNTRRTEVKPCTLHNPNMSNYLYVLKLEDECFYVGVTTDPKRRYEEHATGQGGAWTQRHKFVSVLHEELVGQISGVVEDAKVIELMCVHGISRVRGGTFSGVELDTDEETVQRMIWHAQNRCLGCGSDAHWAADCEEGDEEETESEEEEDNFCGRCGAEYHTSSDCWASRDVNGRRILPPRT